MPAQRKLHWAIVGLGDIVRKRVGAAVMGQPDSRLYACVTRDPAARRADLEAFAPQEVYTDFDAMLADRRVDVVYLATPVHLHAPQAIAALGAGKHVVVEKPMARDGGEAAAMCRTADQSDRRLAVAYYRRFWPRFELVKEMLERGQFGQVVSVRMALNGWYNPAPDAPGAWRIQRELSGGGVLGDVGSHRLDLLAWWFGLPRRLVANVKTLTHAYDVEDSAAVLMEMEGGVEVTASFNWNSKTWADEIHVVGTEATVSLCPCDGPGVTVRAGRDVRQREIPKPDNHHYPLIDDFARAVLENRPPRFTAADGIKATQIIDAIYASSRQKGWISFD